MIDSFKPWRSSGLWRISSARPRSSKKYFSSREPISSIFPFRKVEADLPDALLLLGTQSVEKVSALPRSNFGSPQENRKGLECFPFLSSRKNLSASTEELCRDGTCCFCQRLLSSSESIRRWRQLLARPQRLWWEFASRDFPT